VTVKGAEGAGQWTVQAQQSTVPWGAALRLDIAFVRASALGGRGLSVQQRGPPVRNWGGGCEPLAHEVRARPVLASARLAKTVSWKTHSIIRPQALAGGYCRLPRRRNGSELLKHCQLIKQGPALDDLAAREAVNLDALDGHLLAAR
jgi:hypothetical protein